ncbi:MAG: hypothetical protein LUQ59_00500 [Methanothrix sp.]|nr:hypothetical protein [Methanothrix sp.]
MFYLGEYDEDTAKEIKRHLDKAGLKVESKSCLVIDEETTYYIKDKMSAISELTEEDTSRFKQYLGAMKSVLPQATPDNFGDLYLKELLPDLFDKRDEVVDLLTSSESTTEKVKESLESGSKEWDEGHPKMQDAKSFATMILENNEIKIGEPAEDKLEDPVLLLLVSPEKFDTRPKQLKYDIDFYLDKSVTVYVDEFTAPLTDDIDEDFWDKYPSEAQRLKILGLLIEKLAITPSSRKMDFAEFAEECVLNIEDEDSTVNIDGFDVADDLARVLEKSGVIKRKGDKIKWKGKD